MSSGSEEKFCLRWNDFEANISSAFRELKDDEDFFDVTLACDSNQIRAHKVILSACSPFFKSVLKKNPHQHPLLYLKGVKYEDITSVLNFIYHGEVNVAQEELNSFLSVAEDLQIKGLTQSTAHHQPTKKTVSPPGMQTQKLPKHKPAPLGRGRSSPGLQQQQAVVKTEYADTEVVLDGATNQMIDNNDYSVEQQDDYQYGETYQEHELYVPEENINTGKVCLGN